MLSQDPLPISALMNADPTGVNVPSSLSLFVYVSSDMSPTNPDLIFSRLLVGPLPKMNC